MDWGTITSTSTAATYTISITEATTAYGVTTTTSTVMSGISTLPVVTVTARKLLPPVQLLVIPCRLPKKKRKKEKEKTTNATRTNSHPNNNPHNLHRLHDDGGNPDPHTSRHRDQDMGRSGPGIRLQRQGRPDGLRFEGFEKE